MIAENKIEFRVQEKITAAVVRCSGEDNCWLGWTTCCKVTSWNRLCGGGGQQEDYLEGGYEGWLKLEDGVDDWLTGPGRIPAKIK